MLKGKKTQYQNLLLRKVLLLEVWEVKEKKHLPYVREGDTPQRKARVSKLHCKTSRNQIPDVDLGAVLPRRASGCVGCRRKGKHTSLGLLGY